mgnify:CR=1 FL=1
MKSAATLSLLLLPFLAGVVSAQDDTAGSPAMISSGAMPTGVPGGGPAHVDAPADEEAPPSLAAATAPAEKAAPSDDATPSDPPEEGRKNLDFLQRSNLVLAKLLDSERVVDPFGMLMDPANAKATPYPTEQYETAEAAPALDNSALKNALLSLPITGVYPQRKLIVIGARSFPAGGQFGMKLHDLTVRLRFEGIRDGEIFFQDMETREVTSIPFNPRPAEFEPLVKGAKQAPGSGIVPMSDLFIAN